MSPDQTPQLPDRAEISAVLARVFREIEDYLSKIDELPVRSGDVEAAARSFEGGLPEHGVGADEALRLLLDRGRPALLNSSGPRFYHFVMGGGTPAALGADFLASLFDQAAYAWLSSPLGTELEVRSIEWLVDLFELPGQWSGLLTTGATMANFVALSAARQWWGEQHGFDVAVLGMSGAPAVPVFSSGYVHASAIKVLGMLGIGRGSLDIVSSDARGRLDIEALELRLQALEGAPAIVIGNAGEVNAGDFDPLAEMAELCGRYDAWFHVDGAFGLFARLTPRTRALTDGVERADSVISDGHKWLNVPYDCGFAFVRERRLLAGAFAYTAAYLQQSDDSHANFGVIGPESSRRARAFAVWATLQAYGRSGYQALVEGHLDLAQQLAARIDAAPELTRLADVPLNIVCFRFDPGRRTEAALDDLNRRLGEAILEDGRYYVGNTIFEGKVALRPAMVNWRTEPEHVDGFVDVIRELAARL